MADLPRAADRVVANVCNQHNLVDPRYALKVRNWPNLDETGRVGRRIRNCAAQQAGFDQKRSYKDCL